MGKVYALRKCIFLASIVGVLADLKARIGRALAKNRLRKAVRALAVIVVRQAQL